MLTLEQVNRLHPTDPEARRRLADFYERGGLTESIAVWREAVALAPGQPQIVLGLARAAIRFGDRRTAREALAQVAATGMDTAEYHRLRAGLATLERDRRVQEESLARLAELEPEDVRVRLNLAALHLADPSGPNAEAARRVLRALAEGDRVRMRAVVELLGDVARRWPRPSPERSAALSRLAAELTEPRGPILSMPSQVDHIDRLVRHAMDQPEPEAEDVISLTNWMSLNGQTEAALEWIGTLPPRLSEHPLLRTAQADYAVRVGDWTRLREMLLAGAWGPVPTEAVEQAFRVRAEAKDGVGPHPAWTAALDAAKNSPAGMRMLLRLAELWRLNAEYRQVLQAIARAMPGETWAWRRLISLALEQGDSEQVWQVYLDWRLVMPGDPVVQVESAIMGTLLGRRRAPLPAETEELLRREPGRAGAVIAHALALWRAGRPVEAAQALAGVPPAELNEPRYALAAGIVLAEAGRPAESEELLKRLAGDHLLPEERALLVAAHERNRGARR